ncbi:MAG: agmatine deiminase family protein [Barnesiella sp.]|nr:agmatine deiminase family protein [Barnesiella sp.]
MNETLTQPRIMPAEWESHQVVLMSWPNEDTDWVEILPEVTACYSEIISRILEYEKVILIAPEGCNPLPSHPNLSVIHLPYNDTWTRDYGPITVKLADGSLRYLDFAFNGWGLKFAADRDNLVASRLIKMMELERENHLGFVLEGGSIESDGKGMILTTSTCLESPNRNGDLSRNEIEEYLKNALGAKSIYWLECSPLEGDDTDAHIDTIARLAPDNTIIYVGCDDPDNVNYHNLLDIERQLREYCTPEGRPFNLVRLPSPDDIDGNPATYANFLVSPRAVFVPTYGQPDNDTKAIQAIRSVYHDRDIIGIDCRALIKQHGSLHCATMQLPIL